jgi:hypothetical protein
MFAIGQLTAIAFMRVLGNKGSRCTRNAYWLRVSSATSTACRQSRRASTRVRIFASSGIDLIAFVSSAMFQPAPELSQPGPGRASLFTMSAAEYSNGASYVCNRKPFATAGWPDPATTYERTADAHRENPLGN